MCRALNRLAADGGCWSLPRCFATAIRRIQKLGFVACLHDNYQDIYRNAKSWDSAVVEKRGDGSLVRGGRWLGGRAFMVCAEKQIEMAMRPQNLPAIRELFDPWSYFIDTTYAVGPRECADGNHPLDRNGDVASKCRLSDKPRKLFGLFGSECGREWALPHSDFFEGLVGVSGRYFHNLEPAALGATVVPFWEMVYHDCQIGYGKYGYAADRAAEYVAHHVLCARPLHYHSMPEHRYWTQEATKPNANDLLKVRPRVVDVEPAGDRAFRIRYAWEVDEDLTDRPAPPWRVCVHFDTSGKIRFRDDHWPQPPTSRWHKGQIIEIGPHLVEIPRSFHDEAVDVYIGLFNPAATMQRVRIRGCDSQRRVLLGRLRVRPQIEFVPAGASPASNRSCFTRTDARVASRLGRAVRLPPWGFVVEGPRFAAFYAKRFGGKEYPDGALFTLQVIRGEDFKRASQVRVFHGFGDPVLAWQGATYEVRRQRIITPSR